MSTTSGLLVAGKAAGSALATESVPRPQGDDRADN
jgi:hypothetical protein